MLGFALSKVALASTSVSAALVSTSARSQLAQYKYEVLDTTVNPMTKKRLLSKTASVGLLTVLDYG